MAALSDHTSVPGGLSGGCLCGAVRYHTTQPFTKSFYCHCSICRRANGSPAVAWITVPSSGLIIEKGLTQTYASSETGRREFCPVCGTQLFFRELSYGILDITTASLDDPAAAAPTSHVWSENRVAWFETADAFPRFNGHGPDGPD